MAAVLFFFALFVIGVVAIGILEPIARRLAEPLEIPRDVVQALFIGAGALVTLPFVISILAEARVSIVASLIVGAVILLHAGAVFTYAMFRLIFPRVRVPLSKR
jgi:SNF family Na+-dependent transporter